MRSNLVKHELQRGGHAFGTMVFEFFSPGLPQVLRAAGAEFALFDMEHSGAGIETMKTQAALCRGIDLVPMVRVPATQYHLVSAVLDAGMMGVMVPMVESPVQAREIVSFTRYPPQGVRGAAFGIAHDDYEPGPVPNKMREAMDRTMVIALIETARGVAAVDEIAAVDGVDVLWLGHFDLTNSMGIPAAFSDPRYLAAVGAIVAAAKRYGKVAGVMAADEKWACDYFRRGFNIVAYGLDHLLLQQALSAGLDALRRAARERA
jgi:2-keto-3-deoxy-L-rhamnonate aldolase RhmA